LHERTFFGLSCYPSKMIRGERSQRRGRKSKGVEANFPDLADINTPGKGTPQGGPRGQMWL